VDEEERSGGGQPPNTPGPESPLAKEAAGLFGYVRFVVGDSPYVEDIVQETMVRALDSFDRYDPARPMRAWLRGIALHVAHKFWRRAQRTRRMERDSNGTPIVPVPGRSPEEELLLRERADLMHRALDELAPPLREALILHVGERMPAEEIAELTGTTPTNVYTRVSRARSHVREFLEAERRRRGGGEEDR
jgi:RNA polymerase sigma factor CnrH